jgi:protein-S-isoprenylcysteine O-methyltransferase Ste14
MTVRVYRWIDVSAFLAFAGFVLYHQPTSPRWFIGICIAVAGFAMWVLARAQLGPSFSIRPLSRALVTKGLYSKFRHPIYVFGGIAYLGILIAWGKTIPLICFAVIYLVQVPRARKEEKVLEQAFGDEYRRYKAGTWF